jgi:hypothetical protein
VRWSNKHQFRSDDAIPQNHTGSESSPQQLIYQTPTSETQQQDATSSVISADVRLISPSESSSPQCSQVTNSWFNASTSWDFAVAEGATGTELPTNLSGGLWNSSAGDVIWDINADESVSPTSADDTTLSVQESLQISSIVPDTLERLPQSSPPQELVHQPTALSEYFFREVITLYCTWDSRSNMMRNIIETHWQSFGALHHTVQSMAAACLSSEFPHLAPLAVDEYSRALDSARDQFVSGDFRDARLIAYTMLGHTATWLNPHNLATDVFRDTYEVVKDMPHDQYGDGAHAFFSGTLDYWAMLLAFLTDRKDLGGYYPGTISANRPSVPRPRDPHPYSGLSQETVKFVTEIGILIFHYRKRISTLKFIAEGDMDAFRQALRSARRLERGLLAYCVPEGFEFNDTGDPNTPLSHLQAIDEAYRCTGLLQLYRVFPDLLNERYAPWNKEQILKSVPSERPPTAHERQAWLTKFATHILSILQSIPFESSTRCVQPFIMVAVSSELKHEVRRQTADQFGLEVSSIEVMRARRFVCSRMAAYSHILPLSKSKVILELIECVWEALDQDERDVYWLDVAQEKGLTTMMG